MKTYRIKASEGWYFAGKHWAFGETIQLNEEEAKQYIKDGVKLEEVE